MGFQNYEYLNGCESLKRDLDGKIQMEELATFRNRSKDSVVLAGVEGWRKRFQGFWLDLTGCKYESGKKKRQD